MTTKIPAREGLQWFREAMGNARAHLVQWILFGLALKFGAILLGLAIGSVFGVLLNVAPSASAWLVWLVPLVTQGLTGLLLLAFWWFALRNLNDEPTLTGRHWRASVPAALFWILAPTLVVWAFLKALEWFIGDAPGFLVIAQVLSQLLNLWPFLTVLIGGVLLDQVRSEQATPWFSIAPWQRGWMIFRQNWKPLLNGWLLPWIVLSLAFMVVLVGVAFALKAVGLPLDEAHPNVVWAMQLIRNIGLAAIYVPANLALVVGYRRVRGAVAPAVAAEAEHFPPLA